MKITWYGHSCFLVETAGGSVVLDPYNDGQVPGYENLSLAADAVLCSHQHGDHNNVDAVRQSGGHFIAPVQKLRTFHDDEGGSLRGSTLIHVIEEDGLRLAHMGDIGCPLTESQQQALAGVDVLLLPVGGYYTIDAQQAAQMVAQLHPRVTIPMHYRSETFGYPVLGGVELFTGLCENVQHSQSNSVTVTAETPVQTLVLSYLGGR